MWGRLRKAKIDLRGKNFVPAKTSASGPEKFEVISSLENKMGIIEYFISLGAYPKVSASSVLSGNPKNLLFADLCALSTENFAGSWFLIDVGEEYRISPVRYSFRYSHPLSSGNICYPRNWLFQAAKTLSPEHVRKLKIY